MGLSSIRNPKVLAISASVQFRTSAAKLTVVLDTLNSRILFSKLYFFKCSFAYLSLVYLN